MSWKWWRKHDRKKGNRTISTRKPRFFRPFKKLLDTADAVGTVAASLRCPPGGFSRCVSSILPIQLPVWLLVFQTRALISRIEDQLV